MDSNEIGSSSFLSENADQMTLGDRLLWVRRRRTDLNPKEFGDVLGVGRSSVIRYEENERLPDAGYLEKIVQTWGVDPGWLLTGINSPESEFVFVDYLQSNTAAGDKSSNGMALANNKMAFRKEWLNNQEIDVHRLGLFTARGDAMEPLIRSGDTLLISVYFYNKGTAHKQEITLGLAPEERSGKEGIFLVNVGGERVVKRLQADSDVGYFVSSENEKYEPVRKDLNEIVIVGRVEWFGRRL